MKRKRNQGKGTYFSEAKRIAREKMLIEKEMSKRRTCPVCSKKFSWHETQNGQIHCSRACAFLSKDKHSGRPCMVKDEVLTKLKYAFIVGSTDLEACQYAGISHNVLYEYQKKNPEFKDEKEALKNKVILKARIKVYGDVDNDGNMARWVLEKKRKDEFGNKIVIDGKILTGEMDDDDKKRVQEIAENLGEDDDDIEE